MDRAVTELNVHGGEKGAGRPLEALNMLLLSVVSLGITVVLSLITKSEKLSSFDKEPWASESVESIV